MKQYPCLWFNGNAHDAATFYCSAFRNAKMDSENAIVSRFEVDGQLFMCLNGGPNFTINPSISFYMVCETDDEITETWNKLADGGMALMPLNAYPWSQKYGWVQDKFGVSWQLTIGSVKEVGQKFTAKLMFTGHVAGKSSEAMDFYTSIFHPSSIIFKAPYTGEDGGVAGTLMHASFKLGDTIYMAMDSHMQHGFNFNEAVSFVVECDTQEQIDHYWSALSEGGSEQMCGWLKDRYGVSWQIVPSILGSLMSDPSRSQRVMDAFMKMKKFDIEALLKA